MSHPLINDIYDKPCVSYKKAGIIFFTFWRLAIVVVLRKDTTLFLLQSLLHQGFFFFINWPLS